MTIGAICLFMPMGALASVPGANPIGSTLCSVVGWFHEGSVGVGLASLSIFITGIAALMNKISWGMFIFASLDVALIFGATYWLVDFGGTPCAV